ncbi:MAG: hypothetical protein ACSLE8_06235 [Rhodococcus sp. (in: high G+C Gram-positive bacteria)]
MFNVRKVHHRSTHHIETEHGEVEVQFEPAEWMDMHAERVGDKLIVAYNSLDGDSGSMNPMTDFDGQGHFYTKPSRYARDSVITDDMSSLLDALQLEDENRPRSGSRITIDGVVDSLSGHAATIFLREHGGRDLAIEYLAPSDHDHDHDTEDLAIGLHDDIWQALVDGDFKQDEIDALINELYSQHWREIVGPYVVIFSHCSNVHGPATAQASVANWDGDPDDLPDAVWVGDKDCIENIDASVLPKGVGIRWKGALSVEGSTLHAVVSKDGVDVFDAGVTHDSWSRALGWAIDQYGAPSEADRQSTAEKYAAAVISEYIEWCNGNVFGCCVETFENVAEPGDEPEWESIDRDECWGFIGDEYAEQSLLDDFFKPAVEAAHKEV